MATTTTVITGQPGSVVTIPNPNQEREWSTGLCGCFEDCSSCLLAYCCPYFYPCCLYAAADEFCCLPLCLPGWSVALRTKIRVQNRIRGSMCNDCLIATFCYFCAVTQMHREMKNVKSGRA